MPLLGLVAALAEVVPLPSMVVPALEVLLQFGVPADGRLLWWRRAAGCESLRLCRLLGCCGGDGVSLVVAGAGLSCHGNGLGLG